MALAALCSNHYKSHLEGFAAPTIRFQAFVVDHGVREGSDDEATAVSKVLEARGLLYIVLTQLSSQLIKVQEYLRRS